MTIYMYTQQWSCCGCHGDLNEYGGVLSHCLYVALCVKTFQIPRALPLNFVWPFVWRSKSWDFNCGWSGKIYAVIVHISITPQVSSEMLTSAATLHQVFPPIARSRAEGGIVWFLSCFKLCTIFLCNSMFVGLKKKMIKKLHMGPSI